MSGDRCVYGTGLGTADEKHCAIGFMFDNDSAVMTSFLTADDLITGFANSKDVIPNILRDNKNIFSDVQEIHDIFRYDMATEKLSYVRDEYPNITFNKDWDEFLTKAHGMVL